jgi:1,6-anhydro-N-acetylmuramate kinase
LYNTHFFAQNGKAIEGGVHNLFLFERLICQNPDSKVTLTNDLGVSADYVEAAACPYFALSNYLIMCWQDLCQIQTPHCF